eukprot:836826_1
MGCAASKLERDLVADQVKSAQKTSLLFLGAGECGKSTFLKQCREIYSHTDSVTVKHAQSTIYSMIVHQVSELRLILDQESKNNPEMYTPNKDTETSISAIIALSATLSQALTQADAEHLKRIWADPAVKGVLERTSEFQIMDYATHFVEDRID